MKQQPTKRQKRPQSLRRRINSFLGITIVTLLSFLSCQMTAQCDTSDTGLTRIIVHQGTTYFLVTRCELDSLNSKLAYLEYLHSRSKNDYMVITKLDSANYALTLKGTSDAIARRKLDEINEIQIRKEENLQQQVTQKNGQIAKLEKKKKRRFGALIVVAGAWVVKDVIVPVWEDIKGLVN